MQAYERGDLSLEGQLDPIWAAVQQNDKHGSAMMVADDVGMGKSRTAAGFVLDRIGKGRKRILVVTADARNITNLMENEFPTIGGGKFPARMELVSGEMLPDVKKNKAPLPTYDEPTVYFLNFYQFPDFARAVINANMDAVVVDEVHKFRNVHGADYGEAWKAVHQNWIENKSSILYLSATPGVDIIDLEYLYGLKVWTMDGFGDWVKVLTGELSPEQLKKVESTIDALAKYSMGIADKVRALGLEEVVRKIDGANEIGYDLGNNLFVRESANGMAQLLILKERNGGGYIEISTLGKDDKNTILLIASDLAKDIAPDTHVFEFSGAYQRARNKFNEENPAPKVDRDTMASLGIKDAGDAMEAAVERKKKRFGSRTAFESTLPPEHTEQIIRELKVGGYYMSRDISRAGVVFGVEKVNITPAQIERQNKRIEIYRRIIEASHKYGKMNKADKNPTVMGHIQNDAKRLLFDMRLADTMRLADEALARGEHVVISTVSVGDVVAGADAELDVSALREAGLPEKEIKALVRASEDKARKQAEKSAKSRSKQNQKRAEQGLPPIEEGGEEERGYLYAAVNSINTQKIEKIGSGDSATFTTPEDIPEAMVEILEIKEMIREMGTVPSPIDVLRAHYGDRIGFITGSESDKQRLATMAEFQADRLDVVLISKAGKTGINLHDVTGKHQRHLISADYEWSATDFKQELGRVDRTGQRSNPYVTILHSGNAAEVKFISTIANRMKGLGATSKGGAESTGTGALNDQFELGSDIDKMALSLVWRGMSEWEKALFLDPFFKDKKAQGRVAYLRDIPKGAESIKKFTLGLQSIPLQTANELLARWMNKVADLQTAANAINEAETMGRTGEILRKTELSSGLVLNEVKAQTGHRYGVLTGVLTPHMKTLSDALIGTQARQFNPETGRFSDENWRRWVNFNDNVNNEWASGLEIPPGKLDRIAKDFGAKLAANRTPETVMIDLRAGDKVPVRGLGGAEWNMYIGRGGYREGKVVVDGAKIGQRADIMPHGASFDARGNFFYVTEENIQTFLKRFPIDNDRAGLAQPADGGKAIMYGPDGAKYDVQYKVIPLADLIASHGITFDPDPRYPHPAGVQPRDRSGEGYRNQVINIARGLDERAIVHSPEMTFGTPIAKNNLVINGNGRVMAMRLAQRDYPERWQVYQDYLKAHMAEFGLKADDLEGIKDPVLVREPIGDVDLTKMGQEAQVSNSAQLTALERAFIDKAQIDPKLLAGLEISENETVEGALMRDGNQPIVDAWLRSIPESERPALTGADGDLNTEGRTRLKYAMFAYVYQGDAGKRIAELFLSAGNTSVRNVEQAMYDTLGVIAQVESLVKSGQRADDLAIADDLVKAVDILVRLKNTGGSVSDYVQQMSLEGDELTPLQKQLLVYLEQNARKRARLRDLLALYADNVINVQTDPNQMSLFGGARSSKGEILDAAAEQVTGKHGEFAAVENRQPEPPPAPTPEPQPEPEPVPQQASEQPAPPPPSAPPVGTTDGLMNPPQEEAIYEGWMKNVQPMLARAENSLIGQRKQIPVGLGDDPRAMPADVQKKMRAYMGQVGAQMGDAKIGAMRWGEAKRDAALLNYGRRYDFDNYLGTVMPYEFWYTRAMRNWARRALTKPAVFANYMRLRQFGQRSVEQEGFPTRLKKKMGIRIPFMPKWMGDGVYIDPLKSIFPFEQLAQPWETWGNQKNLEIKRAEGILQQMVADDEITSEDAAQALATRDGFAWKKALATAQAEVEGDIQNPLDLAFTMASPSLPIQIAYNMMTGRKDKISQLPVTRGVQAITGALGIGGPRGVNLEAGIRNMTGLPEVDRYEDYRVDRMLVNLTAEGMLSAKDAQRAMIDRSGPAFEEAQRRVSQMGFWQYFGAPLGLDMFPEGEQEVRALKTKYDAAIKAWKGGDKTALTRFFDRYPEYEARMSSFQEPEERMKRFLISEVWDRYNAMPALYQRQTREQLGDLFTDAFVNKETRSYDSINPETLAGWAQAMSNMPLPNKTPDTAQISLQFAPAEIAKAVEDYNAEADRRYPGIGSFLASFYQMPQEQQDAARAQYPQIQSYYSWKNKYLAEHPDIIPWVTSEKSELFGLPQNIQQAVYSYRAQRDQLFPGIDSVQSAYFDAQDQKAYGKQHPELYEYWDWRKGKAAQNPAAAPYILSDQALSRAILEPNPTNMLNEEQLAQFSPTLIEHLYAYYYAKEPLRSGPMVELSDIWEASGKPYGDLRKWINTEVKATLTGANTY